MNEDAVAGALNRIADALEQLVLAGIPADPFPAALAPVDEISDLPPVRPQAPVAPSAAPGGADLCPIHNVPWKVVPAGVSSRTGKAYDAFKACSVRGCEQRPPR